MVSKFKINFISIIILFYFFYGFYSNENSAGAGGYDGDFKTIWSNLLLLKEGIFANLANPLYDDSRPPLSYIIHIYFNPFTYNQEVFRISCFIISLFLPVLFFFAIKKKFPEINKNLLALCSFLLLLSPYFRTTAYWGLGENYGLIFLVLSYLTFIRLEEDLEKNHKVNNYINIFLTCLFSSLVIYFDQKLIFIPTLILFYILNLNIESRFKYLSIIFFFILSIPYIYLIFSWGSLIPTSAAEARNVGKSINLFHPGYCLTIIAFYIFPFFLSDVFGKKKIKKIFNKQYLITSVFFLLYLIFIFIFGDFETISKDGKGIIHKLLLMFFENSSLRLFLTFIIFFLSFTLIYIFFENKFDFFIIIYFVVLSFLTFPFYQEYLDPLLIILFFTFFKLKPSLSDIKMYFIVTYFFLFNFSSKYYYSIF